MGHTVKVDRLLIRTAAGQAGIGNNDGHIAGSAPTVTDQASPIIPGRRVRYRRLDGARDDGP